MRRDTSLDKYIMKTSKKMKDTLNNRMMKNFKKNLKEHFSEVESSGVIWRNLPPAIIYRCVV